MKLLFLPLVNWGLGALLIGVFALVCVILVAVVYSLSQSKEKPINYNIEENDTDTTSSLNT